MKRLAILILALLACSTAFGYERAQGYCERGGFNVFTQNIASTTKVQRSFVSCTVTVYVSGTVTLATLYSDNNTPIPTPLGNPFTAASDGSWFFYAAGGRYDVHFSNGGIPAAFTRGDVEVCDPLGPNPDATCTPGAGGGTVTNFGAGNLAPLFTTNVTNPTTTPNLTFTLTNANAFTLFGNNTNVPAAPAYTSMDSIFGSCSTLTSALTYNVATHAFGCNSISPSGTFYQTMLENGVAQIQQPALNFINGSAMSVTCVNNIGSNRTDCTFASAGGAGTVSANGTPVISPNFNDTTPAAPVGNTNVKWQVVGSDVSGYVPTPTGTVTSVGLAGTANQITVTGATPITGSGSWTLSLPASVILGTDGSVAGTLQLANSGAAFHNIISSGATANWTLKLPPTAGTNNFVLKTDGSGNTDWVAQSAGTTVSVNSSAVANPNFNDSVPAAPGGNTNVTWQVSGSDVSGYVPNASGSNSITRIAPNDTITGTVLNKAAVIPYNDVTGGHGSVFVANHALNAAINNDAFAGIVTAGAGTAGDATLVVYGTAPCVFSNGPTKGNLVGVSTSVDGDCEDFGAPDNTNDPTGVGIRTYFGYALETNASPGTYNIFVTPIPANNGNGNGIEPVLLGGNHGPFYWGSPMGFDNLAGSMVIANNIPLRGYNGPSSATWIWELNISNTNPSELQLNNAQFLLNRTLNAKKSGTAAGSGAVTLDHNLGSVFQTNLTGAVTSLATSHPDGNIPLFAYNICNFASHGTLKTGNSPPTGGTFNDNVSIPPDANNSCSAQMFAGFSDVSGAKYFYTALAPATPIHPAAITGRSTDLTAVTLATPGDNVLMRFNGTVTCESNVATATVVLNLIFTDVGGTAKTFSTTAANCADVTNVASVQDMVKAIRVKGGTSVQYSTTTANSPVYTVDVSLETIQ